MDIKELELLIPSKTVREYVIETGWTFTDKEKAALICHGHLLWKEEYALIKKLGEETKDAALREQINAWLKWNDDALKTFKENKDRQSVYVLKVEEKGGYWDGEYLFTGYFFNWEEALKFGKRENAPFEIEKFLVDEYLDENDTYHQTNNGFMRFNADGELRMLDCREIPNYWNTVEEMSEHFTEMYFEVPNPFDLGDVVKSHDGTCGIIDMSQKEWKEKVARVKKWQEENNDTSIMDGILWSSALEPDGTFITWEADPLYLERYGDIDFNDPKDALLDTAGAVVKGECGLGELFRCVRVYRESKYYKNENHFTRHNIK